MITGAEIERLVTPAQLIGALRAAFAGGVQSPPRQVVPVPGDEGGRLALLMPAFDGEGAGAIKLVTYFPRNPQRGLPTVQGIIVLFSAAGTPSALLDGTVVTRLRTAAASALASTYLSREDSAHLVIIGTGALAPYMAAAHAAVRPLRRVTVCGRSAAARVRTAVAIRALLPPGISAADSDSTPDAVAGADIVTCVTSSTAPVLAGKWLRPGTFVDLVGGFSPEMRESDDDVVRGARLFVDTHAGALEEAGDLLDPLARGIIRREEIQAELADLVTGRHPGRRSREETTVFKSVGTALEDFAAAQAIAAAAAGSG